jgi:cell division protease FtsH
MLGGRAAEKLVFDEYSAGAEDDLKKATQIARKMVGSWGMSDIIGPVYFSQGEENPFLGKEIHEQQRKFSEETARIIDQEVQRLLTDAAERAAAILTERRETLDQLVDALLEKESLGREELLSIIGQRPEPSYNGRKRNHKPA